MNIAKRMKRGFTLVELMIVVAIVGVLAALAIYGVRKYVLNAKTAEARNALGRLAKDASSAYNRERLDSTVLTIGNSTTAVSNALCGAAAAKVPANLTSVAAKKYQSAPTDWNATNATTGWQCLRFSMQEPQYYQYNYTTANSGTTFAATAEGDLDGDTVPSTFTLNGSVQSDSGGSTVVIAPSINEASPDE